MGLTKFIWNTKGLCQSQLMQKFPRGHFVALYTSHVISSEQSQLFNCCASHLIPPHALQDT